MAMAVWLLLSVYLWMFAKNGLCLDLTKYPKANRSTADHVCDVYNKSVMPDISHNRRLQQDVLPNMDIGDIVWIDALQVTVEFSYSTQYLKFSKHTADSEIVSYFKPRGNGLKKCKNCVKDWTEIQMKKIALADTNGKLKQLAILVGIKEVYWIKDYPAEYKILDPVCVGIIKTAESEYEYRWDNCTNEHEYFCLSVVTAPSVEKLDRSLIPMTCPEGVETGNNTNVYAEQLTVDSETEILAPILGGVFGLIGLTLVVTAIVCFFKRRRQQQRHERMLRRYQNSRQGNTLRTAETSRNENHRNEMPQSECQKKTLVDQYEDYEQPIMKGPSRQDETHSQTPGRLDYAPSAPLVPGYDAMDRDLTPEQFECFNPDKTELKRFDSRRSSRNTYKFPKGGNGIGPPPIPNPKFKKSVNRAASFSVKSDSQRLDLPIHKNYSSTTIVEECVAVRVDIKPLKTSHTGPKIEEIDSYENQMVDNPKYKKKSATPDELEALDQYENYGDVLSWNIGKTAESPNDYTKDGDDFKNNGEDWSDTPGSDQYENFVYQIEDLSKNREMNSGKTKGSGKSKAKGSNNKMLSIDELDQYENYQTPKMPRRQIALTVDEDDQYESYDDYRKN